MDFDPVKAKEVLDALTNKVKELSVDGTKQAEQFGKLTDDMRKEIDKSLHDQTELRARLADAEKKLDEKSSGGEKDAPKSLGEAFTSDEAAVEFMKGTGKGKFGKSFAMKDITSLVSSGGAGVAADRRPGVIVPPEQALRIRDLLMPGRTSSNTIEYVKENVFTNNAAPVSEGVMKPQSEITYTDATATVKTIAHWIRATKQIYADFPGLASMIDGRLRYGLKLKEDAQLLKGTGTGNDLHGIYTQAATYVQPIAPPSPETKLDRLRLMMLQVELAGYPADASVLHPSDWTNIELTKTTDGAYLWANPASRIGPTLWGRPVATTLAMTVDTALVGAFSMAAQIFDREDVSVMVSDEDRDNFVTNKVTILCEERLALAVYIPNAFVKDTNLPA